MMNLQASVFIDMSAPTKLDRDVEAWLFFSPGSATVQVNLDLYNALFIHSSIPTVGS